MPTLILQFLAKHWLKVLPLVLGFGLYLCWHDRVAAQSRADAYARVAEMSAHYAQTQEDARLKMKHEAEDSVQRLTVAAATAETASRNSAIRARNLGRALRDSLQGVQRTQLDSMEISYEAALAAKDVEKDRIQEILGVRTRERDEAERLLAINQQVAAECRKSLEDSKGGSSTGWKVATAVVAVAGGVAYALHP